MGNAAPRGEDVEGDAAASAAISQAAAQGASDALRGAVSTALAEAAARSESQDRSNLAAEAPGPRVSGVLSLSDAQTAASDGATRGIAALVRSLQPSARFACLGRRFETDVHNAEAAAAAGAAAGLRAAATILAQNDQENDAGQGLDLEIMLAAARSGARAGSLAVRVHVTSAAHSARYTGLLVPLLGGSLPASAAVYQLVSSSSTAIRAPVFGGIVLGVLCVSSGLAAGALGSSRRSLLYCRLATLSSFTMLWLFLFFGLCSLFSNQRFWYVFGSVGSLLILCFAFVWFYRRW